MSALASPPSPRLRLVAAAPQTPARKAAEPVVPPRAPRRAHLRLVTSRDDAGAVHARAAEVSGRDPLGSAPAALPAELRRRPARPRVRGGSSARARQGRGSGADGARSLSELSELAPNHPAVRAQRRRLEGGARVRATSGTVTPGTRQPGSPTSSAPRAAVPAALRGLVAAALAVLVVAAVVAAGVVASGVGSLPAQTATATVGQGESLWDIAVATGASDVHEAMAQIVELNGLTGSTLRPGQVLLVPAG